MSWLGKLAGGALGFLMGGPVGAALGAALGHKFDVAGEPFPFQLGLDPEEQERLQQSFFMALFQVMGHVAKSDGRVSEVEIFKARELMARMQLKAASRLEAMRYFNAGRDGSGSLSRVLLPLKGIARGRSSLIRFFITLETEAALAEGGLHPAKEVILLGLCDFFDFSRYEFYGIRARLEAEMRLGAFQAGSRRSRMHQEDFYRAHSEQAYWERQESPGSGVNALEEAYATLDLSARASAMEVKRAYRLAISRHHPDKLTAKGAAPSEIQEATQKTQLIQKAYELICRHRSI